MTEKELHKLFADKLKGHSFPFNEKAWQSMEQMLDPQEPLSEIEYTKLFNDKLAATTFPFNPANWDEMELKLNEEQGAMSQEELKNLFENKLQSQSFAFNPANWERMEAILDSNAKKPLLYFWRSVAAILIFAASALGFYYNQQHPLSSPAVFESVAARPAKNSPSPSLIQPPAANPSQQSADSNIPQEGKLPASAVPFNIIIPPAVAASTLAASGQKPVGAISTLLNSLAPLASNENQAPLLLADNSKGEYRNWKAFTPKSSALSIIAYQEFAYQALNSDAPKQIYVPVNYSKISLQGGPSVNPAYNGSTGTGFFAGLEYEYGFNDRISLSAGLIYNYGGDMGIESISDSTFFGLARTDVETHSHYKNMSSLRMPISFNIKVYPKHSISVGAYADALIAVTMDEQKTTTIFKQDPKVENSSGLAPENSFANYSGGAHFAYTYQYSERLSIGLSQQYGFNDLTNDKHQNFGKHHQTSQTNLVLKYSIWNQ